MKGRARRACIVAAGLVALGGDTALVLNALNANVMFFVTPAQFDSGSMKHAARVRVGGLVQRGSVERDASG